DTRKNSFNSRRIEFTEHSAWFDSKLKSENSYLFICLADDRPAGLVRFDSQNNESTIGILIAKEYRNRGLASIFIKKGCAEFRKKCNDLIFAYIKVSNLASVKSFEKSGFSVVEELIIGDEKAVKYQLG